MPRGGETTGGRAGGPTAGDSHTDRDILSTSFASCRRDGGVGTERGRGGAGDKWRFLRIARCLIARDPRAFCGRSVLRVRRKGRYKGFLAVASDVFMSANVFFALVSLRRNSTCATVVLVMRAHYRGGGGGGDY